MPETVPPLLARARGLRRRYRRRGRLGQRPEEVVALDGADIDVPRGRLVAIVGPSGSGKSTLVRCLAGLEQPDEGRIDFEGRDTTCLAAEERRAQCRRVQLVFQDPSRALSPRLSIGDILCEPLRIAGRIPRQAQLETSRALLDLVGLPHDALPRRAAELSGGQRQRLAIARALALEPALLILDESLAGLDVSLQAQIVNLLLDLRDSRGLALAVVSHDLGLVARVADQLVVMEAGRTVEEGAAAALLARPGASLTRALVGAWRGLDAGPAGEARA